MVKKPLILVLLCCILLPACSRAASQPNGLPIAPTLQMGQLSITSVTMTSASIEVTGTARLPEGSCIQTALYENGTQVNWWPVDICIEPGSGPWQMVVALGQKGAPPTLIASSQYEIRAWWPEKADESQTRYPFQAGNP